MKVNLRINGFIAGLVLAVLAAWLMPEIGAQGGLLRTEMTSRAGVVVIFLFQGLLLPTEDLKRDLLDWRLHLFVQCYNFIIVPLLFLLWDLMFGGYINEDLRVGLLFLGILPTTISTAVVFTSLAGGNVAGAVFNVTLSNTLGVFIVPALSAWLLTSAAGVHVSVFALFSKIATLMLLPMLVGQVLRPWLKGKVVAHKKAVGRMNTGIILFILYAAFCNSIHKGVWEGEGLNLALTALGITFCMLVVIKVVVWITAGFCRFDDSRRITAFFCASQKTLAAGVSMATSIFAAGASNGQMPELGIVVLPLMCYHFLQLLAGGFLAGQLKNTMENKVPAN